MTPSPNQSHQTIVGNALRAALESTSDSHGGGRAFVAPFDVVFSHFDVVEPDILFARYTALTSVGRPSLPLARIWSSNAQP